jgi:FtsH-binding integral membrane protein
VIDILGAIGNRGERALRRSIWLIAGAGLVVIGLGFAAAALVEVLVAVLPRYAALGVATVFLLVVGAVCISQASRKGTSAADPAPPQQAASAAAGDWRGALNFALVEEARQRPARAAARAALAGLILGALDGLDEAKKEGPPKP